MAMLNEGPPHDDKEPSGLGGVGSGHGSVNDGGLGLQRRLPGAVGTGCGAGNCFFFSSRRRHTRCSRDWSSDVCSSDLYKLQRDVDPAVAVAVSPSNGGRFKYAYTVLNGPKAKQSIDQWTLVLPDTAAETVDRKSVV